MLITQKTQKIKCSCQAKFLEGISPANSLYIRFVTTQSLLCWFPCDAHLVDVQSHLNGTHPHMTWRFIFVEEAMRQRGSFTNCVRLYVSPSLCVIEAPHVCPLSGYV